MYNYFLEDGQFSLQFTSEIKPVEGSIIECDVYEDGVVLSMQIICVYKNDVHAIGNIERSFLNEEGVKSLKTDILNSYKKLDEFYLDDNKNPIILFIEDLYYINPYKDIFPQLLQLFPKYLQVISSPKGEGFIIYNAKTKRNLLFTWSRTKIEAICKGILIDRAINAYNISVDKLLIESPCHQ